MKTLIVEDTVGTRELVTKLVQSRGHEVMSCGSVEEAEDLLAANRYDLLILDWMLPGKSGLEFCRAVRQQERGDEYFILLMTARDTSADLDEALEAGANDYLIKPLDMTLLNIRLQVAERQARNIAESVRSRAALEESNFRMERLALVASKTQSGVVIMDQRGIIEWVNDAFSALIRIEKERIEGCVLTLLLQTTQGEKVEELSQSIDHQESREGETELKRIDGSCFWVHYSITSLRNDRGEFAGQVCLFSDITTHKKGDEERFKASKIESLGVLAGGIAHDLNNILTIISGNISLARMEIREDGQTARDHLERANQAALRAAGLSRQLLTFAKGGEPVKQITDLGALVEKTTRFALHGSSLTCLFAIAEDLQSVEVDTFQMEQVFNNLIINARDAMPHGGTLHVRARNFPLTEPNSYNLPAGEYIRLSFSDNGPGIIPEHLERLFDPYFSTKIGGSGLGLTICFSVLSKHGGTITAESMPRGGALFNLLIPASRHQPETAMEPAISLSGKHSVLCMDDEAGIRQVTTALLTAMGYEVTAVRDGKEAIAAYREAATRGRPFSAVILDATIPGGMGGVATIKALLREDPSVRAIICSGYSDESALAELESNGFKASLPKPFTGKQMNKLLNEVIGAAA